MSPVVVRARSELRARLTSVVALALLAGLGAGTVVSAFAGARRTDSSYDRFVAKYLAADLEVYPAFGSEFAALPFDKVAKLPQVVASAQYRYLSTVDQRFTVIGYVPPYGTVLDVPKLLSGRMPAIDAPDEAAVSFDAARHAHLKLGSRLTLTFNSFDPAVTPIPKTVRVVGIEAAPGQFPPALAVGAGGTQVVMISQALYRSVASVTGEFNSLLLRLHRGRRDVDAVVRELGELSGGKPHLEGILGDQAANVRRSIHTQSVALWIVGGLVALIVGLVVSQLLARQAVLDSNENPTLQALGMTRKQVWLTGMGRAAFVGVVSAIFGAVVAVLASPLMPFGTARIAEPNPGFSFDFLTLGLGAAATLLLVLVLAVWPTWRNSSAVHQQRARLNGTDRPSMVGRAAGHVPPPVATGMRLALEPGSGSTEVPVRSSLMSVTLAIAAVAGALTFGAGLNHLLATPRLYGWNWDADVNLTSNDTSLAGSGVDLVKTQTGIRDAAFIDTPPYIINGNVRVNGVALKPVKGLITPIVTDGRAPSRAGEVALGAKTFRDVHAHIGSIVNVSIAAVNGPAAPLKVVGIVVLPPADYSRLGSGVMMTIDSETPMIPAGVHPPALTELLVRFASGVNKRSFIEKIQAKLGRDWDVRAPTRPTDLVNFGQVQSLPLILSGLVGLLAVATLAHTLITAIRRRRRDLAILKMLGFIPRQVRWAVAWQATTFVSVALVIGLPVGVAIGRAIWTLFADQLGALAEPAYPSIALLLTIPAAILLANAIATVPAFIAARTKPAVILRAE